jgi:hypothetical protein
MVVRIVTFGLNGISTDEYEQSAANLAHAFAAWPGLRAKYWLADRNSGTFGGVYLFESQAAADRSRTTELFAGLTGNAAFTDLAIREFDTLNQQ